MANNNNKNKPEDVWRSLISHLPDMVVAVDLDGTILYLNRAFDGSSPDAVVGSNVYSYFPRKQHIKLHRALKQVHQTAKPEKLELTGLSADGELACYSLRLFSVTPNAKLNYICITVRDVTEARRAEQKLQEKQQQVMQFSRFKTMEELTSSLAHELNQPLASILNYARGCIRRLQLGHGDPQELVAIIEKIATQASRAGDILHGLRGVFQKDRVRVEPVAIEDIVNRSLEFVDAQIFRSVTIKLDFAKRLPKVYVDRVQIQQVILNLVQNAADAMINMAVDKRVITIRVDKARNDFIKLIVCDTGPGIGNEDANKIFDPFFTTKRRGMGMGLAIAASVIEAHGGRIVVLPQRRRGGARIQLTLPTNMRLKEEEDEQSLEAQSECCEV